MNSKKNKIINNIKLIVFAAVFTAGCLITSMPGSGTLFHYNSFDFQLIKAAAVFIAVYIATVINKSNIDRVSKFCAFFTTGSALLFFFDNYFFKLSGETFYRLWWLSVIHTACAAVYLGISSLKRIDFKKYFALFFKGYTPLYLVTFVTVFLRPAGESATTNFVIASGTMRFFKYLADNPGDSEIWFLVIGDIVFFIPIAFILKALLPKIKTAQMVIVGIAVPIFIEGYQLLLKCGDVDIDDIILNFAGFLTGLTLLAIQRRLRQREMNNI